MRQQAAQMRTAGRATALAALVVIVGRDGCVGAPLTTHSTGSAT